MLYNLKLVEVVDLIYNCEVLCFNLGYNTNYPVQDFVCVCVCVCARARARACAPVRPSVHPSLIPQSVFLEIV